jgi:hypothetical protein
MFKPSYQRRDRIIIKDTDNAASLIIITTASKSFENVARPKHHEMTAQNQNTIHKEIKNRLNLSKAC